MIVKIILLVAIALQLYAASAAIGLTKRTKYNSSWILIAISLVFISVQRLIEFHHIDEETHLFFWRKFHIWLSMVIGACLTSSIFWITKLFKYIDNSRRQQRKQELKILRATLDAEEQERKRFAKELHDGLGPLLSTVKMSLSALNHNLGKEQSAQISSNTQVLVEEAIRSLREISSNLSPHVLETFGLKKALENYISHLNQEHTKVDFNSNIDKGELSHELDTICYRVCCELINNTFKHAKAKNLSLNINLINKLIYIDFHDNGIGFNFNPENEVGTTAGMGLYNIMSRIKSYNGHIDIQSGKNRGTKIVIKLPYKDEY